MEFDQRREIVGWVSENPVNLHSHLISMDKVIFHQTTVDIFVGVVSLTQFNCVQQGEKVLSIVRLVCC